MADCLVLKWGTVKEWDLESDEAVEALNKWASFGVSMSAMAQQQCPDQKQALVDAIDCMDEIWLDWEGEKVTKEKAKEYVLSYGK